MPSRFSIGLLKTTPQKLFVLGALLVAMIGISSVVILQNQNQEASQFSSAKEFSSDELEESGNVVTAINTTGNDEILGLNVRQEPCSPTVVDTVDWGTKGMIQGEGITQSCAGQTFTWYEIVWENGVKGWSASDFIEISE